MLKKAHIALFLALCACTSAPKEPTLFEEVGEGRPWLYQCTNGKRPTEHCRLPLLLQTRVMADFDGNGFEDIYFVRNQGANALYFNQGNWKFTKETAPQPEVQIFKPNACCRH